jgi:hypothetical protein
MNGLRLLGAIHLAPKKQSQKSLIGLVGGLPCESRSSRLGPPISAYVLFVRPSKVVCLKYF